MEKQKEKENGHTFNQPKHTLNPLPKRTSLEIEPLPRAFDSEHVVDLHGASPSGRSPPRISSLAATPP